VARSTLSTGQVMKRLITPILPKWKYGCQGFRQPRPSAAVDGDRP
jgi:hypothetical protein